MTIVSSKITATGDLAAAIASDGRTPIRLDGGRVTPGIQKAPCDFKESLETRKKDKRYLTKRSPRERVNFEPKARRRKRREQVQN
jgi:hypothetical protein